MVRLSRRHGALPSRFYVTAAVAIGRAGLVAGAVGAPVADAGAIAASVAPVAAPGARPAASEIA